MKTTLANGSIGIFLLIAGFEVASADENSKRVNIVSRENCRLKGSTLVGCQLEKIILIENRIQLAQVPYQTWIHIHQSSACNAQGNMGKLQMELTSRAGRLIQSGEIDYLRATSQLVSLPYFDPIQRIVIQPKDAYFFGQNSFDQDCEISPEFFQNVPKASSSEEAAEIQFKLESEINQVRDRLALLSVVQELSQAHSEGLNSKKGSFSAPHSLAVLDALDTQWIQTAIEDRSNSLDFQVRENLADLLDLLVELREQPKKSKKDLQTSSLVQINTLMKQLSPWADQNRIESTRAELQAKELNYELAMKTLQALLDSENLPAWMDHGLSLFLESEVNGEEGLVARISKQLESLYE